MHIFTLYWLVMESCALHRPAESERGLQDMGILTQRVNITLASGSRWREHCQILLSSDWTHQPMADLSTASS